MKRLSQKVFCELETPTGFIGLIMNKGRVDVQIEGDMTFAAQQFFLDHFKPFVSEWVKINVQNEQQALSEKSEEKFKKDIGALERSLEKERQQGDWLRGDKARMEKEIKKLNEEIYKLKDLFAQEWIANKDS